MGSSSPENADLKELRATDANAIRRLFREYGRGGFPRFALGGVASVLAMTMELVPAYVLSVAIDSLFFDTRPFDLPGIRAGALPESFLDRVYQDYSPGRPRQAGCVRLADYAGSAGSLLAHSSAASRSVFGGEQVKSRHA